MSELPARFKKADRNTARVYASNPYTAEYIKRLELIAEAAWELYQHVDVHPQVDVTAHNLYSALTTIDVQNGNL